MHLLNKNERLVDININHLHFLTTEQFQEHTRKINMASFVLQKFAVFYITPVFAIIKLSDIQNNQGYT